MAYTIYHIATMMTSFLVCLAIYKWLAGWVLGKASPVFATLPPNKQIVLRNCVMSLAHAVLVAGLGWYNFLCPGGALPDKVWYDSPTFRHAACIILGYLLADTLLLVFITALQDRMMIAHHIVGIWASYAGTVIPVVPYYGNLWPMMELSNPFVHLRFILNTLSQKDSLLYKLNGILMLVVFFACRIAPIPLWFQLAPLMATGELYEVGPMMLITIFVLTPMQYGLNIYWFSKICRAACRIPYTRKHKDSLSIQEKRAPATINVQGSQQ